VVHRHHVDVAGRCYSLWGSPPTEDSTIDCVVCFADIVGFTPLGEQIDAPSLDAMLRCFEEKVTATATSPITRVVKQLRDEAMFVSGSPAEAAGIAALALGPRELPGFEHEIEVHALVPSSG
jgi:class 3 adenylate cyclase